MSGVHKLFDHTHSSIRRVLRHHLANLHLLVAVVVPLGRGHSGRVGGRVVDAADGLDDLNSRMCKANGVFSFSSFLLALKWPDGRTARPRC